MHLLFERKNNVHREKSLGKNYIQLNTKNGPVTERCLVCDRLSCSSPGWLFARGRERKTEGDRERKRKTEGERGRQRERERGRQRETQREREGKTEGDRGRERKTEGVRGRERESLRF